MASPVGEVFGIYVLLFYNCFCFLVSAFLWLQLLAFSLACLNRSFNLSLGLDLNFGLDLSFGFNLSLGLDLSFGL